MMEACLWFVAGVVFGAILWNRILGVIHRLPKDELYELRLKLQKVEMPPEEARFAEAVFALKDTWETVQIAVRLLRQARDNFRQHEDDGNRDRFPQVDEFLRRIS